MKQVLVKCYSCNKEFYKLTREVKRQLKNGKDKFYCSRVCLSSKMHLSSKYKIITKTCPICKSNFQSTDNPKSKNTCSQYCAKQLTILNTSEEKKNNRIQITKNKLKGRKFSCLKKRKYLRSKNNLYLCICNICKNQFESKYAKSITCSKICLKAHLSNKNILNLNCGGETNYKRYRYKNILMDSSWEVDLAVWLDSKNIKWERSKKLCLFWLDQDNNKRRYYPDFYLPDYNIYLDPKNKFLEEKDKYKIESVIKINNVQIIYGNLNKIKEYIEKL